MYKTTIKRWLVPHLTILIASLVVPSRVLANISITHDFDSSITDNVNAAAIESAINSAIGTLRSLYSNKLNLTVDFTYDPGVVGNLLSTYQYYYDVPYNNYINALKADLNVNPSNTVLATAVANLSKGNDANGAKDIVLAGAQLTMLGLGSTNGINPVVNINSSQGFAFSRPVPNNVFDLVGGLEHELDEVLGGGGAGSTLNFSQYSCPEGFFCNKVGSLDLYRYSAPGTPSFTTSSTATSYFSVDGGATKIVDFNQNPGADFADFGPPGTGAGQLIQDGFNSTGQDEAYTTSSPEFEMLEAIGFNRASTALAVPEGSTWALIVLGFAGLSFARNSRARADGDLDRMISGFAND